MWKFCIIIKKASIEEIPHDRKSYLKVSRKITAGRYSALFLGNAANILPYGYGGHEISQLRFSFDSNYCNYTHHIRPDLLGETLIMYPLYA